MFTFLILIFLLLSSTIKSDADQCYIINLLTTVKEDTLNIKLKNRYAVCFVLFSIWLLILSAAARVFAVNFPEPTSDFYVNDYADVISSDTENHIIEVNESLESQTGAQVVVVVRDFLDGMAIEDYGYNLFNEWGIGSSEKNNGVLLLLAVGEDDYWITLGRGSESILNMNFLTAVRDQCLETPFSKGDYDKAVYDTVDAIAAKMAEYYKVSLSSNVHAPAEEPERVGNSSLLSLIILFIVIASVFSGFFRSYTMPRRRSVWRNMAPPPPPPPIHGPARPRRPPGGFGGMGGPGGFGGFGGFGGPGGKPPHSGGGFSGGGFSGGGGRSSGGGHSGGGGSSRGGGMGRH